MYLKILSLATILLSSSFIHAENELREWTNTEGKKIKASYVSSEDSTVSLKDNQGKTYKIKLNTLSEKDQLYIQELEEEGAEEEEKPKGKPIPKNKPNNENVTALEEELPDDHHEAPKQIQKNIKLTIANGKPPYQKEWGNYDDPWPAEGKSEFANIEINTIKEEGKEFIYESPHFRFISDAPINIKVVKTIAINFEATFDVCSKLPLGLPCRELLTKTDAPKYIINLYEENTTYFSKGGPPGSAGFYRYPEVHVPFASMGLKKRGDIYMLDGQGDQKTIIHEVVHQMSHGSAVALPHWYSEGLAEYISISSNKNGLINLRTSRNAIMNFSTGFDKRSKKGRAIGEVISLRSMKDFFDVEYRTFGGNGAQFYYGFSSILFMYYAQMEGKGDAKKLRAFAQSLNEAPDNASRWHQRDPEFNYDVLLDGKSWEEYDKEMEMGIKKTKLKFKMNPDLKGVFEAPGMSSSKVIYIGES